MDVDLLPCPFCGERDIEVEREGTTRQSCVVRCGWCGCTVESNEIGCGDAWNTRRVPDQAATFSGSVLATELYQKRLYLPGVVMTYSCPKCGMGGSKDLGDSYFFEGECILFCEDEDGEGCGHRWELKVSLTPTAVPAEG